MFKYLSKIEISCDDAHRMIEEKSLMIRSIRTHVTFSGSGRALLCLHGWGKSVDFHAFDELRSALKDDSFHIIAPDFPGFGKSAEPHDPWSVDDYADFVEELVQTLNLTDVWLLGHSFGGRVSIKLASRKPKWLSRLFLCAAAGVGRDLLIRRRFWLMIAKTGNAIFMLPLASRLKPVMRKILYRLLRVRDYDEASEPMRMTMSRVISEDLTALLPFISVPTDLFWGEDDCITPLHNGELMNKKIVQSVLHTYTGVHHRVHRERAREIALVLRTLPSTERA